MAKATRGSRKQSKTSGTGTKSARGSKSKAKAKVTAKPKGAGKSKGAVKAKGAVRAKRPAPKTKTVTAGRSSAAKARRPSTRPAKKTATKPAAAAAAAAGAGIVLGNETDRTDVDWAERAFGSSHEGAPIGDPGPEAEDPDSTDE